MLSSSKPLTKKDIQRNNEIGHWINENVVVRLCAILQSHSILSEKVSIDKSIDGWKEVDLLRRLLYTAECVMLTSAGKSLQY